MAQTEVIHLSTASDQLSLDLLETYRENKRLFMDQPGPTRNALESQAHQLAEAVAQNLSRVTFALPGQVSVSGHRHSSGLTTLPESVRQQKVSAGFIWTRPAGTLPRLASRLEALEGASLPALSTAARLLRFAMARYMVDGFEIRVQASAQTVEAARQQFEILRQSLQALKTILILAPYMTADDTYQNKYTEIENHLVNQGRALAESLTEEIIHEIQRRAAIHSLNRGLAVSLPFFDEQQLGMRLYDFSIIPPGRVQFVPAFVVLAARNERDRVAQDTHLSSLTQTTLLHQLGQLERAFIPLSSHPFNLQDGSIC